MERYLADEEFAVFHAAGERLAGDDVAAQNALCQQRLHRVLHVAAQRTRAELRIVGRVDDELLGFGRQLTVELLVLEPFVQSGNLQVDDAGDVLLRERLVEDDLVEAVQMCIRDRYPLQAGFGGRFAFLPL